jgi:hypothetical protein
MDETTLYCIIIIIINSIVLLLYHFRIDPNKDIERYYYKKDKIQHCCFKLAYLIILLSLIFSIRYLLYDGMKSLMNYMKSS